MRRIVCLCLLLLALPAAAQMPDTGPDVTPPERVAMLYAKLTRQPPDFAALGAILKKDPEALKQDFILMSTSEPVTVETEVKLSNYNVANSGFFIQNFRRSTFFSVQFQGKNYALVPQGIIDKQWMRVEDQSVAEALELAARASPERLLKARLVLSPQYADSSGPASIGGTDYLPLAVTVNRIFIYGPGESLLWQSGPSVADIKQKTLVDLYQ